MTGLWYVVYPIEKVDIQVSGPDPRESCESFAVNAQYLYDKPLKCVPEDKARFPDTKWKTVDICTSVRPPYDNQ